MNDILFKIVESLIVISIMVLTRYAIPLLKTKVKNSNLDWLADWAVYAVKAAEQTNGSGFGHNKKTIVKEFLVELTNQYNVTITDTQLENLIEAAVYAMKQEDSK